MIAARECANCAEWQGFDGGTRPSECAVSGKVTLPGESCGSFWFDPTRFCGICGYATVETEHSGVACSNNANHVASQWDYEWHDFSRAEGGGGAS